MFKVVIKTSLSCKDCLEYHMLSLNCAVHLALSVIEIGGEAFIVEDDNLYQSIAPSLKNLEQHIEAKEELPHQKHSVNPQPRHSKWLMI